MLNYYNEKGPFEIKQRPENFQHYTIMNYLQGVSQWVPLLITIVKFNG